MKYISIVALIGCIAGCRLFESKKKSAPDVDASKYVLSFVDSTWLFKGKPFKMQEPIGYYIRLFGPYSRAVNLMDSMYVWDSLGIEIAITKFSEPKRNKLAHQSDRLYVVFNYEYQNEIIDSTVENQRLEHLSKEVAREENDARPKPFFQGSINLGNVELHRGIHIDTLINRLDKRPEHYMFFSQTVLPHSYKCAYDEASNPFVYYVHMSDSMIIDEFILDMGAF